MGRGVGRMFQILDDVPPEVTEAGLSLGESAVTAITPPEVPDVLETEQPEPPRVEEN